jgi:hypothetical protein
MLVSSVVAIVSRIAVFTSSSIRFRRVLRRVVHRAARCADSMDPEVSVSTRLTAAWPG